MYDTSCVSDKQECYSLTLKDGTGVPIIICPTRYVVNGSHYDFYLDDVLIMSCSSKQFNIQKEMLW